MPIRELPLAQSRDKTGIDAVQHESTVTHVKLKKKEQERIIPGDLGILPRLLGRSLGLSTSIRKGWLHELMITSAQEPDLPPSTNSCGFKFGPTMVTDKLVSILRDTFF